MAVVLALETSGKVCSVALGTEGDTLCASVSSQRNHNQQVLRLIDGLEKASRLKKTDISAVSFSCGPGSFTGVRLGASIAQGIAFALNIGIVLVPSSLAMAHRIMNINPAVRRFFVQRHSHKDHSYLAEYRVVGETCECVEEDRLVEDFAFDDVRPVFTSSTINLSAIEVLDLALQRLDESVSPHEALPLLVDGDAPYRPPAQTRI